LRLPCLTQARRLEFPRKGQGSSEEKEKEEEEKRKRKEKRKEKKWGKKHNF